ncbi:LAME_0D00122g1_1 [Lachancea meyersii CBS 8951]|uniref:LAME_0D00122g1_1 n=1 Tax=Lachancea meyersii CBS 8951 TaxID=1266667 RepID=A0A1G4J6B1_9SACH|nr:LAME_0D00122g1_1 [Lachancea meyersii CBS 8951]
MSSINDVQQRDLEKNSDLHTVLSFDSTENVAKGPKSSFYDYLKSFSAKTGTETKGIEPVTEDEKNDASLWNAASMWFSANLVIAAFSVGLLGPLVFELNFWGCVISILIFGLLGVLPVSFFSLFGAELGLRQMVLSRYLLGNATARIFALINIIACVGWGAVNTIASAQLLHMVNPHGARCPPWAGCLIIVCSTIIVSFFGYRVIHMYQKWAWVPNAAVFLIVIARIHRSGSFEVGPWKQGSDTAAGIICLGGIVFGFASGWTTYAADYTVYMPRTVNKLKVFLFVAAGLMIPLSFTMLLGSAAACAALNNPLYMDFYEKESSGGLLYAILVPKSLNGFGQFCCVVLAMSTVANCVPNMYSIGLGTQSLWEPLAKVPRALWTVVGNLVTLAIAIPAYYKFAAFMSSFMDAIAYYIAIYIGIALTEHFLFRKGKFQNYSVAHWSSWRDLPVGFAGCLSLILGAVGVAVGMSQTYWTGQIGSLIGTRGGDIGLELGFAFAVIAYTITRPLELKLFSR